MAFLGQEEQLREFQDRFKYLYVALFVGLGVLLVRLVDLQILRGERMRQFSEENRIKRVKIASPRGMIFDRNRKLLIDNQPAFDLEIIPQYLKESKQADQVIRMLSELIQMPEKEIQKSLEKSRGQPKIFPIKIKTDLSRDEVATIESWKIAMPGVQIAEEIKRTNVFGDIGSHLLGYIGEINSTELPQVNRNNQNQYKLGDSIGKFGLEQRLEDVLRGIDGERLMEVDALGRTKLEKRSGRMLDGLPEKPPVPGKNIVLTIDQDLQQAAVEAFGEKVGSLVAIDPRNGEILAMVSRPSFDPTQFSRGIPADLWAKLLANESKPLGDKTIQDHYPPGSTFKVVTAIAGLEEGVIDESTRFHCSGKIAMGNRAYHCHLKKGHGDVNVVSALTQSCDIFFYRVAQRLKSVDDIAKWATHMGLGRKTGINLAREVPGLIPTEEWKMKRFKQPWSAGETLSVAIGQSYVLTTALQLANLYASIGNGGTLYQPHFLRSIESTDGQVEQEIAGEVADRADLAAKTRELIMQGLWGVVNAPGGTAVSQRLPGMDFVGKTGTVQVIRIAEDKIYQKCDAMKFKDRHHGVFAGFAPAKNPVIAVAVIAEHACSGSRGAAPIARAVVKKYLEKYFPDIYGEKAIAARLKGQPGGAQALTESPEDINLDTYGTDFPLLNAPEEGEPQKIEIKEPKTGIQKTNPGEH
jgi:penicillin-binding protein 2